MDDTPKPPPPRAARFAKAGKKKDAARRKVDKEELRGRVRHTLYLIQNHLHMADVIARLRKEFKVSRRQAYNYVDHAKKLLVEHTQMSKDEHRGRSYRFYANIITMSKDQCDANGVTVREKMDAQKALDKLLGLDAPIQVAAELTGKDGGPVAVAVREVVVGTREEAAAVLAALQSPGGVPGQ